MAEADTLPRHRGTRAIQRMVEFAPSTGGLALWVRHEDLAEPPRGAAVARTPPPIATDGHTLYYAAAFERLPLAAQVGLIAHEVLHVALRHPQRFVDLQALLGDVDLRLFTLCADAIVNSTLGHLSWLELPASAITLEGVLSSALDMDPPAEAALLAWDVESLYRAIDDRRPRSEAGPKRTGSDRRQGRANGGGQDGRAGASGGGDSPRADTAQDDDRPADTREDGPRAACVRALGRDAHADLLPGTPSQDANRKTPQEAPEAQADQARSWNERLLRAHAGDGAHSMLRTLIADLPKPRTPWEQVLRVRLARGLSTLPAPSWSRPSRSYIANQGRAGKGRRMPWEPGSSGIKRVPRLALVVDVSGSIDDALLKRFAGEIEAIARRLEAEVVVVIGDDRVRRVMHFRAGLARLDDIAMAGGGGTDFAPLLEEADRHRPDIGVVLTDLEGPAQFAPRWPVIWAVPRARAHASAPFGRLLQLD